MLLNKDYFSLSLNVNLFICSGKKDPTVVLEADQKVLEDKRKRLLEVKFNQVIDKVNNMFVNWENLSKRKWCCFLKQ